MDNVQFEQKLFQKIVKEFCNKEIKPIKKMGFFFIKPKRSVFSNLIFVVILLLKFHIFYQNCQ